MFAAEDLRKFKQQTCLPPNPKAKKSKQDQRLFGAQSNVSLSVHNQTQSLSKLKNFNRNVDKMRLRSKDGPGLPS